MTTTPDPSTARRSLTPKERKAMHEAQGGKCRMCRDPIPLRRGSVGEHWKMVALGNEEKPDCLLCDRCAHIKTNGTPATSYGSDKHALAKTKRLRGETCTGPKRKIASRGFRKYVRRRMGGVVERRE